MYWSCLAGHVSEVQCVLFSFSAEPFRLSGKYWNTLKYTF